MKRILAVMAAIVFAGVIIGCQTATATKTSKDGTQDTIKVSALLSTINQGAYSNGSGMTLSVQQATPDQQSIAILAGTVGELAKAAMAFAVKAPTNSPSTNAP